MDTPDRCNLNLGVEAQGFDPCPCVLLARHVGGHRCEHTVNPDVAPR